MSGRRCRYSLERYLFVLSLSQGTRQNAAGVETAKFDGEKSEKNQKYGAKI